MIDYSNINEFERFFKSRYQTLLQFAAYYVHDLETAEDVVQDVFFQLWNQKDELHQIKNMESYIRTAVKNQALKKLRKRKIRNIASLIDLDFEAHDASPLEHLQHKELQRLITDSINHLPAKCRRIFQLSRFEHLTYPQIAEVESISVKTVETQMSRALKFLRKKILPYILSSIH